VVKRVDLSEESKKLFDEFCEILDEAYEKYLEFHDARCKSCGGNCHETTRILELHVKFAMDTFTFAAKKLREKRPELAGAEESILLDQLNRWSIINSVLSISSELSKNGKDSGISYIR